jgi:hypothetical protein
MSMTWAESAIFAAAAQPCRLHSGRLPAASCQLSACEAEVDD